MIECLPTLDDLGVIVLNRVLAGWVAPEVARHDLG